MNDKLRNILSHANGTSQTDRLNTLLHHEQVKIDERELADYLALLYKYAGAIKFYNLKNKEDGNWQPFLASDITFLLARIVIIDVEKIDIHFNETLYSFENEVDSEKSRLYLRDLYEEVWKLIEMVNEWYGISNEYNLGEGNNELADIVRNAITYRLGSKYKRFQAMAHAFHHFTNDNELAGSYMHGMSGLDKIWGDQDDDEYGLEGESEREKYSYLAKQLTFLFKDFLRVITYIVNLAPKILDQSLSENDHAPQNALVIAFLRLFDHVKGDINSILKKHLDYYYFDKLKQKLHMSAPDQVHLTFALSDHIEGFYLEKGTLFTAGQDEEGYNYLYKADDDLVINKAIVSDLRVLFLSKQPIIAEGDKYKLISNIYQAEVPLIEGQSPVPFPTLGEEQFTLKQDKRSMHSSEVGYAVSSPVLLLKEGYRKIKVDFKFNLKSMSPMVSFLEDFSSDEKISAESAFQKVFSNSFEIYLSKADGWYEIDDYRIVPDKGWTSGIISFDLELGMADPAITGLPLEHPDYGYFDSKWPVLKVLLSTKRAMYAYSYLRDLIIEECDIKVEVEHIKGLQVFNNLGKLDISSPFYPFGTTPVVGSFMLIGYDEVFKKDLKDLTIDLEWHNLPRKEGGFKEYYRKYNQNITNDSFKVSLRALSGYEFFPKSKDRLQYYTLFEEAEVMEGQVRQTRLIDKNVISQVDIDALQISTDYNMDELPDYDNTTRAGYLKLELVSPEMGFGQDLYPGLFANEVVEKSKPSNKEPLDLPNVPFAPQLRTIYMGYKASSKIFFKKTATRRSDPEADEKFYHLNPFGTRVVFKNSIPYDHYLLPQFDDNGYLFMGLSKLNPPEVLTIYFLLEQRKGNDWGAELPTLHWKYLANDQWIDFEKSDIIFDSTNDFTSSGIIKLSIPDDITDTNSILPYGKHWICASAKGNVDLLPKTKGVYTQTISASWQPHKQGAQWTANIPAGTIEGLLTARSEIGAVLQVAPSFWGFL
ncbi:hypothetical protein LVD15_02815 [Fulvivirga maritima]|uniref:hypothetical protein n=1 Tax=Fulvivirga maritima TaxID=2904247 RepID=UPI001F2A8463|nr:hypothetical protein [Fulvivirga maritima]UII27379.1 hypothetical protein LVD15_02815 [Fulvivirga maritima]